ncbi:MAG: hypothetical protein ACKO3W_11615, partial [bacterium]
ILGEEIGDERERGGGGGVGRVRGHGEEVVGGWGEMVRLVHGTCRLVPGTGWHVPYTGVPAAKSLWPEDFGA